MTKSLVSMSAVLAPTELAGNRAASVNLGEQLSKKAGKGCPSSCKQNKQTNKNAHSENDTLLF